MILSEAAAASAAGACSMGCRREIGRECSERERNDDLVHLRVREVEVSCSYERWKVIGL